MKNSFNTLKAKNLLVKAVQSTTGAVHLAAVMTCHATEYVEKKLVTKILSGHDIKESEIVNDRRKASIKTEKEIKAFNAKIIAKAKEYSKATHTTTMTLVDEINPLNQAV